MRVNISHIQRRRLMEKYRDCLNNDHLALKNLHEFATSTKIFVEKNICIINRSFYIIHV